MSVALSMTIGRAVLHTGMRWIGSNGATGISASRARRTAKSNAPVSRRSDRVEVRTSISTPGFEVFPDIAGRDAHVVGGGGDIFRDNARMNEILAQPAHVYRVDVLLRKQVFAT